jgi:hypothetical protein
MSDTLTQEIKEYIKEQVRIIINEAIERAGGIKNLVVLNMGRYKTVPPYDGNKYKRKDDNPKCQFSYYSDEGITGGILEPPQTHVRTPDGTAKFWLNYEGRGTVELEWNRGVRDINGIKKHVEEYRDKFLNEWYTWVRNNNLRDLQQGVYLKAYDEWAKENPV